MVRGVKLLLEEVRLEVDAEDFAESTFWLVEQQQKGEKTSDGPGLDMAVVATAIAVDADARMDVSILAVKVVDGVLCSTVVRQSIPSATARV
jgi:hypothetical protein